MSTTHKCDRCGTCTDEIYILSEITETKKLDHELCKKCAKEIKQWLSDPYIDMVYKSKPKLPGVKDDFEKKSEELSCYDKWRIHQFMSEYPQYAVKCLCDLHK